VSERGLCPKGHGGKLDDGATGVRACAPSRNWGDVAGRADDDRAARRAGAPRDRAGRDGRRHGVPRRRHLTGPAGVAATRGRKLVTTGRMADRSGDATMFPVCHVSSMEKE